jgi:D-3-phosphoglycerate dehydrogenase
VFRLWFERGLPPGLDGVLRGRAVALEPGPPGDQFATLADADAVIASSIVRYDAEVFDRAARLRVVARTGIGVDRVDVAEATRRGIAVCNAPDAPSVSTAEHTIALLLAVAKRLKASEARLRRSEGDYFGTHEGVELAGKTAGVIGYGRIGRRVAGLARAFGMKVVAYDPHAAIDPSEAVVADGVEELLTVADVVTLHLPLDDDTRHLIDSAALQALKPGALLINTARGGLVDHEALERALASGHLGGAGLDVTEPEPLPADHPLLARDDVVVTPHVAAATGVGRRRLYETAVRQALAVLDGGVPEHVVNPETLSRRTAPRSEGD